MRTKHLVSGQKFAKLTVMKLDRVEKKTFNSSLTKSGKRTINQEYYLCKCDCGKYTVVEKTHLTKKVDNTLSCGCVQGTHHKTNTRLYKIWAGMRKRCFNVDSNDYKNYGGRGINLCEDWEKDFMNFYNWAITNGYKDTLTIERIDINKNYEPTNCKWIPKSEQSRNRRGNWLLEHNGQVKLLSDWCEELSLKYHTLYMGLKREIPKYTREFSIVGRI